MQSVVKPIPEKLNSFYKKEIADMREYLHSENITTLEQLEEHKSAMVLYEYFLCKYILQDII